MNKFVLALVASFAIMGTAQAIPSNLNQSLRILEAIENSNKLSNAIPQHEFIVDITRTTRNIHKKHAFYEVITVDNTTNFSGVRASEDDRNILGEEQATLVEDNKLCLDDEKLCLEEEQLLSLEDDKMHSHHSHSSSHNHRHLNTYIVEIQLTPNPQIGPDIIHIISVTKL